MPQIEGGKTLRRTVRVYGVEGDTYVTLSAAGLTFTAKGTKLGVSITWPDAVKAASEPGSVPSKFAGRPYEFLQYQAVLQTVRRSKRLEKEIKKEIADRSL